MIRLVKWQFPVHSEPYMFSTEIVLGNRIMLSRLQADNWQWGVIGLGLSKAERAIFDCKRFDFRGILNIYLGKWIVSYNRKGYKGHMKAVKITTDKVLI